MSSTIVYLLIEQKKVLKMTKHEKSIIDFIEKVKRQSIIERTAEGKEKNGIFLGKYSLLV